MEVNNNISNNSGIVKDIRLAANLTQVDVANMTLVSSAIIQRVEAGTASPKTNMNVIEAILRDPEGFRVSPENIVRLKQAVEAREHSAKKRLDKYDDAYPLSSKDIRGIRTLLGYSQTAMAVKMDVSQGTLARWESETDSYSPKPIYRAKFVYLGSEKIAGETGKTKKDAEDELYRRLAESTLTSA